MRGDGRVYKRGETFWVCYYLRGVQYRESTESTDENTAKKFLKARLRETGADLIGARSFVTPRASKLTIREMVAALRADFELRGKLSQQNGYHLGKVERIFGDKRAVELTAEKIDAYISERLAAGDKPATINRVTGTLGQCFTLAIRREHLSRKPHIRHLPEHNTRTGFFSESELAAVISHLPEELHDFVKFAACTGMRSGEIKSLTWNDVDGDVLTLRAENSKNGEARVIPLVGELGEILERRRAARQVEVNGVTQLCEFFFHRYGAAINDFRKAWKKATKLAGCPGRLVHDLRRSAVRNMVQAGVHQAVAQKISGHKSASMFTRYNIVCTDDLRSALAKTDKYRDGEAAKQTNVVAIG
jgi:integrase